MVSPKGCFVEVQVEWYGTGIHRTESGYGRLSTRYFLQSCLSGPKRSIDARSSSYSTRVVQGAFVVINTSNNRTKIVQRPLDRNVVRVAHR